MSLNEEKNTVVEVFENKEFGNIRIVMIDGEPWFVGRDVAKSLGFVNPRDAIKTHVFDEDKGVDSIDTLGGRQKMTLVNESGMYALIFGSKLPKAKEFKHWVTSEVLPSIVKTGSYSIKDDDSITLEKRCKLFIDRKKMLNKYASYVADSYCLTFKEVYHNLYLAMDKELGDRTLNDYLSAYRVVTKNPDAETFEMVLSINRFFKIAFQLFKNIVRDEDISAYENVNPFLISKKKEGVVNA